MPHQPPSPSAPDVIVGVHGVSSERAGRTVLADISFVLGPRRRIGVIGPNGVGKSTLLEIIAGRLEPDSGTIDVDPAHSTIGLLAQEHHVHATETVREHLTRRVGVAEAEEELTRAAQSLSARESGAESRYDRALWRFSALGSGDIDARIESVLSSFGLAHAIDRRTSTLSGGEESKVALASMELSRFDVTLLDEPTNDLDFAGLDRLEAWVGSLGGPMVIVSHDREFLARCVTEVLEIDEFAHTATFYGGGYESYLVERDVARHHAREAFELYESRRLTLEHRAQRQREWAVSGVKREKKSPRDNDKAQRDFRINRTEKLAGRVRRIEKSLENLERVDSPFEGWNLSFSIAEAPRSGDVVARLVDAVVTRGLFSLGPIDLEVAYADRISLTGPNGSGKSTLVRAILGACALERGQRWVGPSVVTGVIGQDRRELRSDAHLSDIVTKRCSMTLSQSRSLLAKFGLGADHATRAASTLSPGERTRAELAIFQGRGVNLLVLDEPTNHLDLPAIEQLEQALAAFAGTLVMVTHDRRLLANVASNRRLELRDGQLQPGA